MQIKYNFITYVSKQLLYLSFQPISSFHDLQSVKMPRDVWKGLNVWLWRRLKKNKKEEKKKIESWRQDVILIRGGQVSPSSEFVYL